MLRPFAFGKNWSDFAPLIDHERVEAAKNGMIEPIPADQFEGKSFIDIGCGSGLYSLAAGRLGAARILAVDSDRDCIATTRSLLTAAEDFFVPRRAEVRSVFELDPERDGRFDIVYSWGVLHHTGNMWRAIERAASMVEQGGLLVLALYRQTRFDRFWKIEKRFYAHAP